MTTVTLSPAVLRVLRDISSGHLTLWAEVHHYDVMTGERLPRPVLVAVHPDRDLGGASWESPLAAGLLELAEHPDRLDLTTEARHQIARTFDEGGDDGNA